MERSNVAEVDFIAGELLLGVDEYDRQMTRHQADLHECERQGGVVRTELHEVDKEFLRACGGWVGR